MANQGDLFVFEDFNLEFHQGGHKFHDAAGSGGNSYKFMLCSDDPDTFPGGASAFLASSSIRKVDFTEVTGTGYTAGGVALQLEATRSGAVVTIDNDSSGQPDPSWSQNGAGPTGIKIGVVYDDSHVDKRAVAYVDMRDGGTSGTAISLQSGDISYTFNASGLFTSTVNN